MLSRRTQAAILAMVLSVLVVEGFLVYRYYAALPSPSDVQAVQRDPGTSEATRGELADSANAFVHRATFGTVVDNSTYLDYPPINGNPDAVLLVTWIQGSGGDAADDAHPVGVWYDANRGGSWAIFNQDLAPMSVGATFGVVALEEPGETVFVHRATSANTTGNATYVDDPSANERPDAVLAVTPSWNPGGGGGTYDDHPMGVRYDAEEERWTILNLDLAPMPEGAAFDVAVAPDIPAG